MKIKNYLPHSLLLVLCFSISSLATGQEMNKFFATYEEVLANSPLEGYDIVPESWIWSVGSKETMEVKSVKGTKKNNVKSLPAKFFTYAGFLMRTFDGQCYIVISHGDHGFYSLFTANQFRYYSKGMTGELVKYKKKIFEPILKENGLYEDYKEDKPIKTGYTGANTYFNLEIAWQKKYFDLLNKKLK